MEIELPDGTVLEAPDDADPSAVAKGYLARQAKPSSAPSLAMAPIGGAEMLWQGVTGAAAAIPAALAYGGAAVGKAFGADVDPSAVQGQVQSYFTHRPISDSAKAGNAALGAVVNPVIEPIARKYGEATSAVSQRSPFAGELMRAAPGALQAVTSVLPAATGVRSAMNAPFRPTAPAAQLPGMTAEDVISRLDTGQSMGAAAAAPRLTNVSPELRQAITSTAQKTGGAINPEVLARHVEADTLPVRVRLTEGQATQDPMLISKEMNERGKNPDFIKRFDEQNKQLAQNIQAIRDEAGPDVFSANPVEHGDTLVAAYKAKNDAAQADISAKYKALEDANGGAFPIDAPALLKNASTQLHKKLVFEHAPKSVMGQLERMLKEGMTFEQFEAMRTNLATIQRTATDGLEKKAAGIIRSEMEKLPLSAEAKGTKSLADEARKAAKAQFDALDADPAYDAAVNDAVPPDRFVNRFLITAPRDNVSLMRQNLASDDSALQTMGVATLDHLRDAARLNPHYEGNFAAASFNKALQALSPKLSSLMPAKTVEQLERLGSVAGYTTSQPRGSLVNNSNTFVAGIADYGTGAVEGAVNVAAHGVPVGTWGGRAIRAVKSRGETKRTLAPGAGLGRLPEPPPKPRGLMQ